MLEGQKKMSTWFYALLSLPATAMGFGLSVQISALSWILLEKYGLSIGDIGIVWAAGPLAGIIAQPIVGAVSDKLWFMGGRRRPWILVGGILTAFMLLALPNLGIVQKMFGMEGPAGLLPIAVCVALTLDLSINVSFNPTRSLVADCTTQEQRSKGYTWMQTVSGTCGVLAYLIAVLWGNETLIYVGMVIAVLFTVFPIFFIEEPRELKAENAAKDQTAKNGTSFKDINNAILPLYGFLLYGVWVIAAKLIGVNVGGFHEYLGLNIMEWVCIIIEVVALLLVLVNAMKVDEDTHEFQKILLAHSFTWWGVQTMNIYMLIYVLNVILGVPSDVLNIPDAETKKTAIDAVLISLSDPTLTSIKQFLDGSVIASKFYEAINSLAFLVRDLIGAILPVLVLNVIAKRKGMTHTHTGAILAMALGYAIIYFFGANIFTFFVALIIVGIGWASLVSLPFAIMSSRVNQTKMGFYMGIFNLSVVLPQLVASFKMGEVVQASDDKSIIFAICAICLFISGVLWIFVKEKK